MDTDVDVNSFRCSECFRSFGTLHGMKVHRGKTCLRKARQRRSPDRQTRSKSSQDANHSGQIIATVKPTIQEGDSAEPANTESAGKPRILWPAAKERAKYKDLEERVMEKMKDVVYEDGKCLSQLAAAIYDAGVEEFGTQERKRPEKKVGGKSRRGKKMEQLRKEKRELKKQWKEAPPEEKEGLNVLHEELKRKCRVVQRQVRRCARRRESRRNREQFIKNPYQAAKKLFTEARSGSLKCTKEELDAHVKQTYSDPRREEEMPHIRGLKYPTRPGTSFKLGRLKEYEVDNFVKKARAGSAPGGDGVSYKAFKYCDKLRNLLFKMLADLWDDKGLIDEWCTAEGIYLPKEGEAEQIGQFRPISLLSVIGKVYLGIIAKRTVDYLQSNGYVDESVQKAGVPGIPGCVEHAFSIWEAIQGAKKDHEDLNVVWLDLANAYGSVPHELLMKAMDFFYIPGEVKMIMKRYYDKFRMRFTTENFTTEWHRLEIGIAAGCTISVIWFILVMEMLLRAADCTEEEAKVRAPKKAFMDDVTLLTRGSVEMESILARLDELVTWSRMKFKAKKSRSLSFKKGLQCQTKFSIAGDTMPTVKEEPVKSLGRWYAGTLSDKSRGMEVMRQAEDGLKAIEGSKLPGKFKVWCLQYGLYPRLAWPLMIYEVALSRVEIIEQKCNTCMRKWLGLPRIINTSALYRQQGALQLPFTSIVEIYKAGKVRTVMMLRESRDPEIRDNPPDVRTARKWRAEEATDECVAILGQRDIVGAAQRSDDRTGVGGNPFKPFGTMTQRERRTAATEVVKEIEAEKREVHLVECSQQGQLLQWQEQVVERKIGWKEIWEWTTSRLSFLMRSTYDVLPSPVNLVRWKVQEDDKCLCGERGTMKHILSNCFPAMRRYTWRHNEVLKVMYETAKKQANQAEYGLEPQSRRREKIVFVPEGEKIPPRKEQVEEKPVGERWEVAVDLPEYEQFFPIPTSKRPDLVLWQESEKVVHLVELTVPHEDNMEAAHERKKARYEELVKECEESGWKAAHFPVEVGCRGYVGVSMRRWLKVAGLSSRKMSGVIKKMQEVAEKASHWIWLKRSDTTWME